MGIFDLRGFTFPRNADFQFAAFMVGGSGVVVSMGRQGERLESTATESEEPSGRKGDS